MLHMDMACFHAELEQAADLAFLFAYYMNFLFPTYTPKKSFQSMELHIFILIEH